MVNWRLSYIRCALLIKAGVIFDLRPPVRPRARAAAKPATVRSLISAASYSAISANMPNTSLPCAVVVSTMPLVNDRTPTRRSSRTATMSTRSRRLRPSRSIFQTIRVSPGRRSFRHACHCGSVSLGTGGDVLEDLEAAFRGEGVELQLRILVGGAHSGVPDLVSHHATLSKLNPNAVL